MGDRKMIHFSVPPIFLSDCTVTVLAVVRRLRTRSEAKPSLESSEHRILEHPIGAFRRLHAPDVAVGVSRYKARFWVLKTTCSRMLARDCATVEPLG